MPPGSDPASRRTARVGRLPAAPVVAATYAAGLLLAELATGIGHAISSIALAALLAAYCATRQRSGLLVFVVAATPGAGGALLHSALDWDRSTGALVLLPLALAALWHIDNRPHRGV